MSLSPPAGNASNALALPFSAKLSDRAIQRSGGSGLVDIDIRAVLHGAAGGTLEIQILGQPLAGGGVSMQTSSVSVGPAGQPLAYQGQVTALNGSEMLASVSNGKDTGRLDVRLSIDARTNRVSGTVSGR